MAQLLTSLDDFPQSLQGAAISVGNFDGVHRGHAGLVRCLVAAARQVDGPAIVMTFDPHPAALLYPERPLSPPLTTIQRRAALLGALGVDAMIAYPTDHTFLNLSAAEFFQSQIVGIMRAKAMVEGPNFRFGRDREGDVSALRQLCAAAQIDFTVSEVAEDESGMISSTRIRQLLIAGDVAAANRMLTQPYSLTGIVARGAQRGRELGFPTANLEQISSLIPGPGVYAGFAQIADRSRAGGQAREWAAAINVGPNPTFGEQQFKLEVHLIDYAGDALYGNSLSVRFARKIRNVHKFESVAALRKQVSQDVDACRCDN